MFDFVIISLKTTIWPNHVTSGTKIESLRAESLQRLLIFENLLLK